MTKYLCLVYSLLSLVHPIMATEQIIFQYDSGQAGDHLTSLYNAYVYAKKYNLQLRMAPFANCELFTCSRIVKPVPVFDALTQSRLVCVRTEQDIINNLHKQDVHFYVNVLSKRIVPDHVTKQEARELLTPCWPSKVSDEPQYPAVCTVAVHIRKGNGGGQQYDGELASAQIFQYDQRQVRYIHDAGKNPFTYFKVETAPLKYIGNYLDRHWSTKFPPEQYYLDQINKVARAKSGVPLLIQLITDDKDPQALLARFKQYIKHPHVTLSLPVYSSDDAKVRFLEDLYCLSHAHTLIRGQSGFGVIAEVIGDHETVIFPIKAAWINQKLLMTTIVVRGNKL